VLAAAIETSPGDAETLEAADAAMNVFDPDYVPDIPFVEREGQASFSPLAGVPGAQKGQFTFRTEVHGSGVPSGPVPMWASVLFPAVGLYDASGTFKLESKAPEDATGHTETLTIGAYVDGVLKILKGCMGTCVFNFEAGVPVSIDWTFSGIYVEPTDVGLLTPTYPTVAPLKFLSSGLKLTEGSTEWDPKVSRMSIDLGNEVLVREDQNAATGFSSAVIVGRRITGTLDPEQRLVGTKNLWSAWTGRTEQTLAIALGSVSGNKVAFSAPAFQITELREADRGGVSVLELSFQLNRSASAGDDELSLTFS